MLFETKLQKNLQMLFDKLIRIEFSGQKKSLKNSSPGSAADVSLVALPLGRKAQTALAITHFLPEYFKHIQIV